MRDTKSLAQIPRDAARLLNPSIGECEKHTLGIAEWHMEFLVVQLVERLSGTEHAAVIALAESILSALSYEVEVDLLSGADQTLGITHGEPRS